MADKDTFRVTCDLVMLALKIILGKMHDHFASDINLDEGVEPVNATPHLIWKRVWLAQSDDDKGRLGGANSINFHKCKHEMCCSTHVKEVTENVKKINELQDMAQESSADGKGPPEKLKIELFLQGMQESGSESWLAMHAKNHTFKEIVSAMMLDAVTRDKGTGGKSKAMVAKEPQPSGKGKKKKSVPSHVECFICDQNHHRSDCPRNPDDQDGADEPKKFKGRCNTCQQFAGHMAKDCPKKDKKKKTTKANVAKEPEPEEPKEIVQQQQPMMVPAMHPMHPCFGHSTPPGLDFELTSEHAMAVEGLEVSRKLDEHGVVRGHATHTASGETAQLTACRKLFCLSNVPVKAAHFESSHLRRGAWVIDETTLAAKATKATIDLR